MQAKTFLIFASSKHSIAFIIFQVTTWFAVGLNVPILRQFLGFFFLSFVPGLVILKALHIDQKSLTHIVLFSVGLSLVFLMIIGLLLNSILPLIGISTPLSTFHLVITVTILELFLLLKRRQGPSKDSLFIIPKFRVSKLLLLIISTTICSILGSILIDYYSNNALLLFTFVMISVLILLSTFGKISSSLYPVVIFAIALALLFPTTLSSHYLSGYDIHLESYLAQVTLSNQYWNSALMSTVSASINNYSTMLSITLLPTIYSNVLNVNIFFVFTIIYPLLFALVPVALFLIYERQIGSRFAFWSVFFFVSFSGFYGLTYIERQMIAEIFFILIFLLLFELESNWAKNSRAIQVMLIVFAFSTVVSHYTTTFICIFFLIFFSSGLIKAAKVLSRTLYLSLFVVITFSWYLFVSNSTPIYSFIGFLNGISTSIQDLFTTGFNNPVLAFAAGTVSTPSAVNGISRFVFILVNVIIAIGFFKVFFVRKYDYLSKGFLAVSVAGALFILVSVVVPFFSAGLGIARIYQFGLFFTAPLLVIGGEFIFQTATKLIWSIPKIRCRTLPRDSAQLIFSILFSVLLITFCLFQAGVISNVAGGVPSSLSLTIDKREFVWKDNIGTLDAFTFAGDVFGARWMDNYVNSESTVYSDSVSLAQVLLSYGMINPKNIFVLSNSSRLNQQSLIYLRTLNVEYGLFEEYYRVHIITEYYNVFENADLTYSNGHCEIFYTP